MILTGTDIKRKNKGTGVYCLFDFIWIIIIPK
jgi:hypothetical protein